MAVQPIIFRDDSLARGIETAGSALGAALGQRAQESRERDKFRKTNTILQQEMEKLPKNPTGIEISKFYSNLASRDDVDPTYLNQSFQTLMPFYKSVIDSAENSKFYQENFPESSIAQNAQSTQQQSAPMTREAIMEQRGDAPFLSPEQRQQQGIPAFQQPQTQAPLQGQALQSAQPIKAADKYSIFRPGLGNITRSQIDLALIQKDPGRARLGQALDQQWRDEYKENSREAKEIRTENRDQIRKYAEPYQDTLKFDVNLNKLKEAEKLIDSGKVGIDDQWIRTAATGILEGRESPLAELVKTKEQQKLWYLLRDSLRPKELGGTNPSTREVLLAMSTLPSGYKGNEANKYIIKQMIQQAELDKYKGKEISRLRMENENIPFTHFQQKVDESVGKYAAQKQKEFDKDMSVYQANESIKGEFLPKGEVWIMDKEGQIGTIPQKDLKRALKAGGTQLGAKK